MSEKGTINDIRNTQKFITYKKENPSFDKIEVIEPMVLGGDVQVHGYFQGYDTPLVILHLIWNGNIKVTLLNKNIHGLCQLYTVLKRFMIHDAYRQKYGWRTILIEIDYYYYEILEIGGHDIDESKLFIYTSLNDKKPLFIHIDMIVLLDIIKKVCNESNLQRAGSYKKKRNKRQTKRKNRKSFKKRKSKRKTKRRR